MPQEVSDIKQFIEICRRKDAKCIVPLSISLYHPRASSSIPSSSNPTPTSRLTHKKNTNSGAHKAQSQNTANQIQSPMPPLPIHPRAQRLEQSGQAKAELTSKYVFFPISQPIISQEKKIATLSSVFTHQTRVSENKLTNLINQPPRSHKHNQRRPKEKQEREEGSINRPIESIYEISSP